MSVLVDTCVLSELQRKKPQPEVVATVQSLPDAELFLSVVTIGELTRGITQLDTGKRRETLTQWIAQLREEAAERILPIDLDTAQLWGELTAQAAAQGRVVHASDGLIAATALRHGLTVMTRNTRDFEPTGVRLVNPWPDEDA